MDSSICVAVITGRRASQALAIICFCTTGTFSGTHLHAQIASCDHHTIGDGQNGVKIPSIASGFSSLAITGTSFPSACDGGLGRKDVLGAADKAHRDKISASFQGEREIVVSPSGSARESAV